MPARRTGPRRRAISVTSLIDVIFLLLLFFMLTSTFTRFAELPLHAGTGGRPEGGNRPPLFLQLGAEDLRLNGQSTEIADLAHALPPLAGEASALLVSLGEDVTSQRLIDLLTALPGDLALPVRVLE